MSTNGISLLNSWGRICWCVCVCVCTCLSGFCFHFTCFLHNKGEKKWFVMPSKCGKDRERWSGEMRFDYWCVCCCNCCFVKRARKNNRKTNDVYKIFFVRPSVRSTFTVLFLFCTIGFSFSWGAYLYVRHTCAVGWPENDTRTRKMGN